MVETKNMTNVENESPTLKEEFTDDNSLRGTLFSTIIFVGGGILAFILVLFYFYMTRI